MLINMRYSIATIIALAIVVWGLSIRLKESNDERLRLSGNQSALLSTVESYKTKCGDIAYQNEGLLLTKRELERNLSAKLEEVKSLRADINRLKSISTVGTSTTTEIKTPIIVPDSIDPGDIPPIRVSYSSPYVNMHGEIRNGEWRGTITTKDTIIQTIERIPKRFLFIKYGTKGIRQRIRLKNPDSEVVYTEYIELE